MGRLPDVEAEARARRRKQFRIRGLMVGIGFAAVGFSILRMPGMVALPRVEPDGLHAEVLWVDRFGNCQLNVGPEDLAPGVGVWAVSVGDERRAAKLATSFGELGPGSVGLVLDSHGMYALAFDQRSAAHELRLATGDVVVLAEFDDDGPGVAAPMSSPVVLRRDR